MVDGPAWKSTKMGRFLFYLSYIGTRYSGIQAQYVKRKMRFDIRTVQGSIIANIKKTMRLTEDLNSLVSSRTDAGVHAVSNAITIDLPDRRRNGEPHDLIQLQKVLNFNLRKSGHEIRIHKIQQVDDDFAPWKRPFRRSYVYRLGIVRDNATVLTHLPIPVLELQYSHIVYPPFNMDKFLQAAEIMCGTHNFLSFTTEKSLIIHPKLVGVLKNPVKNVSLNIRRSAPLIGDLHKDLQDKVEFWEVHVTSKSYLYKQIRKMISSLVDVAIDKYSLDDLKQVLDDPQNNKRMLGAFPATGLFLKDVEYHPHDLIYKGPLKDLRREYKKLSQTLDCYMAMNFLSESGKNTSETFTDLNIENSDLEKDILQEVNVINSESESINSDQGQITLAKNMSNKQYVNALRVESLEEDNTENSKINKITCDQELSAECIESQTNTCIDEKTQNKPKKLKKVSHFF